MIKANFEKMKLNPE